MEQIYIFMLVVLFILAIFDLMVGVSNDAVNFLNSAVGSKVATLRTIMIVASIGIAIGAIFSNGMMEVAKQGIFNPEKFYFQEIMYIFVAVMLTDILLLDFFNSMGLPTSTTVSIVFELLGASMAFALMKVIGNNENYALVFEYINTANALKIITGIFVSVGVAFTVGSIVQYLARLIFTFSYERKMKYLAGIFGGISLTFLFYFLVIKGLKDVSFISKEQYNWVKAHTPVLLGVSFIFFFVFSQILQFLRINILKIVILTGTFGLAMAFAGNDLVNFIGVPIAAWDSFQIWIKSGLPHDKMTMESLTQSAQTPQIFLVLAGVTMILTLWFSKKAKNVIETGVSLSRQDEGTTEKFQANALSRVVVRMAVITSNAFDKLIPRSISRGIDKRFQKPEINKTEGDKDNEPAFDLIRAAINLVISSALIALGTSMKLPLSTTYVTFMVAMGSSLADRAWGRETAVYRVAGVFNVVGGWFLTAGAAFSMTFVVATLLFFGTIYVLIPLVFLVMYLLIKSAKAYRKKQEANAEKAKVFEYNDLITINEIVKISSQNISKAVKKIDNLYINVVDNLATENLAELKVCKKKAKSLENDIEDLKSNIYRFIKSLDDSSVASSKFYIVILDYLHNMSKSISFIADTSYSHTNNNHKKLKYNQIRDLKNLADKMHQQFQIILEILNISMYSNSITKLIAEENAIKDSISVLIEKQIKEIRTTDSSPKNTKLYFSLLLETKVLIRSTINLMSLFKEFKDQYKAIDMKKF